MKFLQDKSTALTVAWMINAIAYSIVYPFLPVYFNQERGIPIQTVGLIFPIMGAGMIFGQCLAGQLADRYRRSVLMHWGQGGRAALFILLTIMVYFTAPFWLFTIILFINTAVGNLFQVGADAYLADRTSGEERSKAYGKTRIGVNIGWAVGPMTGALLSDLPYEIIFMTTAILCLVGEFYTTKFCPEPPRHQPQVTTIRSPQAPWWRSPLWSDYYTWVVLISSFLVFCLASQLYSILSVYATNTIGISRRELGFVFSLNGAVIIFLQLPIIRLLDRLKMAMTRRLILGAAFYTIGYWSLGWVGGVFTIMICVFILTLGEIVIRPTQYDVMTHAAPPNYVGRYMAALGLTQGVAFSLGPYLSSLVYAGFAQQKVWLWSIIAQFGVGSMLGFIILHHSKALAFAAKLHTRRWRRS